MSCAVIGASRIKKFLQVLGFQRLKMCLGNSGFRGPCVWHYDLGVEYPEGGRYGARVLQQAGVERGKERSGHPWCVSASGRSFECEGCPSGCYPVNFGLGEDLARRVDELESGSGFMVKNCGEGRCSRVIKKKKSKDQSHISKP